MSISITRCPLCGEEIDREAFGASEGELYLLGPHEVHRFAEVEPIVDEPISALLERVTTATLEARSRRVEEKCVAHMETQHRFRYWLHQRTRGLLGIQRRLTL